MNRSPVDLSVDLGGLVLKNPVITASGTFGYGEEAAELYDLSVLGAVTVKGLSLEPRAGNPPPRICETPAGMLNAIGLQNVGVHVFLREKLPRLRRHDTRVLANIYGSTAEEYAEVARLLDGAVDGVEINISCPNVRRGGLAFGVDPAATQEVVRAVRAATTLPLIVKLSPNVTDVTAFARIAQEEGADAVSLINTLLGMEIDVERRRPRLAAGMGGLSGPAVRPVALRMVYQTARAVSLPVIGMGGIASAEDAVAFLLAGASAVAVGTAALIDPFLPPVLVEGIAAYLRRHGFASVREIVGRLRGMEP